MPANRARVSNAPDCPAQGLRLGPRRDRVAKRPNTGRTTAWANVEGRHLQSGFVVYSRACRICRENHVPIRAWSPRAEALSSGPPTHRRLNMRKDTQGRHLFSRNSFVPPPCRRPVRLCSRALDQSAGVHSSICATFAGTVADYVRVTTRGSSSSAPRPQTLTDG